MEKKYVVAKVALEFRVGVKHIVSKLVEGGFTQEKISMNYKLSQQEYNYLRGCFEREYNTSQQVEKIKKQDLLVFVKNIMFLIRDFEVLNESIEKEATMFSNYWQGDEIRNLIQIFKDKLPLQIVQELTETDIEFEELIKATSNQNKEEKSDNIEIRERNDYVEDYEAMVMSALANGDGDLFGL